MTEVNDGCQHKCRLCAELLSACNITGWIKHSFCSSAHKSSVASVQIHVSLMRHSRVSRQIGKGLDFNHHRVHEQRLTKVATALTRTEASITLNSFYSLHYCMNTVTEIRPSPGAKRGRQALAAACNGPCSWIGFQLTHRRVCHPTTG